MQTKCDKLRRVSVQNTALDLGQTLFNGYLLHIQLVLQKRGNNRIFLGIAYGAALL